MSSVRTDGRRGLDALAPLVLLGVCVALVATGFGYGGWWPNVHNGLLSLSLGAAAVWTLLARPWHREGLLLGAVALAEGVVFLGRQIGHADPSARWWAWLGVWPVALVIAGVTWGVLCFPEGRFLSRPWRWVGWAVLAVAGVCTLLSALWPVEYAAAGLTARHPFDLPGGAAATRLWSLLAHPAYAVFQLAWVVAVVDRWRRSNGVVRHQLGVVVTAAAVSLVLLVLGLAVAGSPVLGLLATVLVPLAAWWAMDRLSLGQVIEETRAVGRLEGLSPRESEVLDLMAQGLSNQAIAARLHLSVKTIEPVVSLIFTKLSLPPDTASNRRVLAVLAYLKE